MSTCKECGQDFEKPWQLGLHVSKEHKKKEKVEAVKSGTEAETPEVPEVERAFAGLLNKFRVKDSAVVAENISRTGGEHVFEVPGQLAERLATWHESITPSKRKQILEQWFAERGIEVPGSLLKVTTEAKQGQDGDGWDAFQGQVVAGGPYDFNRARQLARDQLLAQSHQGGDNEETLSLKRELAELKEKQLRTEILQGVREQLEPLKLLVTNSQKVVGATEFDIMSKAVDKLDRLTTVVDRIQGHIEGVIKDNPDLIRPLFRPPLPDMHPNQQAGIVRGIEETLIDREEVDKLAQRVLYDSGDFTGRKSGVAEPPEQPESEGAPASQGQRGRTIQIDRR